MSNVVPINAEAELMLAKLTPEEREFVLEQERLAPPLSDDQIVHLSRLTLSSRSRAGMGRTSAPSASAA